MLNSVNLNIVMFRDRKNGIRRVYQVGEFMPGKETTTANIIYRWVPERDEIIPHNESLVFIDEIGRHTGMSQNEINQDLERKKSILNWLIKNNIRDLNSYGKVMNIYYNNPNLLDEIIKKNDTKRVIVQKKVELKKTQKSESEDEQSENEDEQLIKKDN